MRLIAKRLIKDGKLNEVTNIYKQLVALTREEDGCVSYELFQDEKNDRFIAVIEEWKSKDDFDKHIKSSHFINLIPKINDLTEMRCGFEIYNKLL